MYLLARTYTPLPIFIYAKSFFTSSVKLVNWSIWIFIDITVWQSCTIVTFCHRDSCQVVRIFDEFNPPWFNPIRETAHIEYLMYEIRCHGCILRGFTCLNMYLYVLQMYVHIFSYSNKTLKGKHFTKDIHMHIFFRKTLENTYLKCDFSVILEKLMVVNSTTKHASRMPHLQETYEK